MPDISEPRYHYFWVVVYDAAGLAAAVGTGANLNFLSPEIVGVRGGVRPNSVLDIEPYIVTSGRPTRPSSITELVRAHLPEMQAFAINQLRKPDSKYTSLIVPCTPEETVEIKAYLNQGSGSPSTSLKPNGSEHMAHYTLVCSAALSH